MGLLRVSRFAPGLGLLLALALAAAGCATSRKEAQVQRLHAEAIYEAAQTDLANHNVSLALSEFRQAVALDSRNAKYHNGLGWILLNLKLPESRTEAVAEFRKAIELDSSNADFHNNLGAALVEESRWEDAIKEFRTALSIPTFAEPDTAYYNIASALCNLGRYQEGEESARIAIRLNPTYQGHQYMLGLALVGEGRAEEAKAAFRRAREMAPNSTWGLAAAEHLRALGEGG